jgi:hypothetical protein
MMFTNKHVVIAMIVAPILSILAWFAVGNMAGEKAEPAQAGQSYPLVEKSNCRYESGNCDLENEDFKLSLFYQDGASGPQLVLRSSHPLEGVVLAVGNPDSEVQPGAMRAADGQGLEWLQALEGRPGAAQRIRLAARADGSSYFADASTMFLQPKERELTR